MSRKRWQFLVPWVGLGALALQGFAGGDFEDSYRKARTAIDREQWLGAIAWLEQSIGEGGRVGDSVRLYGVSFEPYLPYYHLGLAYYHLGNHDEAMWAWTTAEREGAVLRSTFARRFQELRRRAELAAVDAPPSVEVPPASTQALPPIPGLPPTAQPGDRIAAEGPASGWVGSTEPTPDGLGLAQSRALVVGVSNYGQRSAWPSLPGVRDDIAAVEEALERHGFVVTVERDPTKNQLVAAMEDFFFAPGQAEAARLIFYYAGHGETLPGRHGGERGYLVPADAPSPLQAQRFRRSAISMARFQEYAAEAPARHLLFLFDSCFSGAVFDVVRSAGVSGSAQEKIAEPSRMFIAAGDKDQEVPDKSYFRRAFVEGLDGAADLNQDGVIFGVELGQFIADQVTDRFYSTNNRQTPRWGRSGDFSRGDIPFLARVQAIPWDPTP